MTPLPEGDVKQWDVLEWAYGQAKYLTSSQHHLLLYLASHAFYKTTNGESARPGQVLYKHSYVANIQLATSMGRRTVQRALRELQEAGYVMVQVKLHNPRQPSVVTVAWTAPWDELREHVRAGTRQLPKAFAWGYTPSKVTPESPTEGVIVSLETWREGRHSGTPPAPK